MVRSVHPGQITLHASAVAFGKRGLILLGKSGTGKSTLVLQLLGLGAGLVSDDGVVAEERDGALTLSAPAGIDGLIEARNFGLLRAPSCTAVAHAVVDMNKTEKDRLPQPHETQIGGVSLPLFYKVESPAFPAMLRLYMEGGTAAI